MRPTHSRKYILPHKIPFAGPTRAAINRSDTKGWVDVVSPYNADYIEDLKTVIQPSHRKWDPNQKVWRVSEIYLEELVGLLKMHFDEVTTNLTEADTAAIDVNIFNEVFNIIPKEYRDKTYFALCQALHPDHGGNEEQMKLLNKAYSNANSKAD